MFETVQRIYMDHFAWWMYFGPLLVNAIWYTIELWLRVQDDRSSARKKKEDPTQYISTYDFVTIGSIFYYIFLIVTPIVNALATIFDAAPGMANRIYKRFEWLFSIKLVNLK